MTESFKVHFHRTIVPPLALLLIRGISGSKKSSVFREYLYSVLKSPINCLMSDWNICTSFRKIKSGSSIAIKCFRENTLFRKFSIFQVKDLIVLQLLISGEAGEGEGEEVTGASASVADLSENCSLKLFVFLIPNH